jgi:hypothetical protein
MSSKTAVVMFPPRSRKRLAERTDWVILFSEKSQTIPSNGNDHRLAVSVAASPRNTRDPARLSRAMPTRSLRRVGKIAMDAVQITPQSQAIHDRSPRQALPPYGLN